MQLFLKCRDAFMRSKAKKNTPSNSWLKINSCVFLPLVQPRDTAESYGCTCSLKSARDCTHRNFLPSFTQELGQVAFYFAPILSQIWVSTKNLFFWYWREINGEVWIWSNLDVAQRCCLLAPLCWWGWRWQSPPGCSYTQGDKSQGASVPFLESLKVLQ